MRPAGLCRFQELAIGDWFEFDHSHLTFGHRLARGPWQKLGPRRYVHLDRPTEVVLTRSLNALVQRLSPEPPGGDHHADG